eukprot:4451014-Karenia_brevis.AAC.1
MGLKKFIADRYFDVHQQEDQLKRKLHGALAVCRAERLDGKCIESMTLADVVGCRANLSCDSAGGKDGTVSEMWKTIPFSLQVVIWIYFRLRAEFGSGEVPEAWQVWVLQGLPKILHPTSFDQFRYICKSPVLQK